jgi:hypothetical protein
MILLESEASGSMAASGNEPSSEFGSARDL